MTPSKIIQPDHKVQLDAALDQIKYVRSELDLAQRANINPALIAQLKQKLDDLEATNRQVRSVYFPGQ